MLYHKGRYLYFVVFAGRRSILERYSRVDRKDLSRKEIARFLKANAARAKWIPDAGSKQQRFKRSDGKAEAAYGKVAGRPALTVRRSD